jgi:hypothetical protein
LIRPSRSGPLCDPTLLEGPAHVRCGGKKFSMVGELAGMADIEGSEYEQATHTIRRNERARGYRDRGLSIGNYPKVIGTLWKNGRRQGINYCVYHDISICSNHNKESSTLHPDQLVLPPDGGSPMKKLSSLLLAALLIGCGGGGGGGGSSAPAFTPPDITGHYVMTGVTARSSNGYTFTENDFYPWGGYIDIGHVNLAMSLTLLGDTSSGSGPLSLSWSSPTEGVLSAGGDGLPFTLSSSGQLVLHMASFDISPGVTGEAWLYYQWSSPHTSLAPEVAAESTGTDNVDINTFIRDKIKNLINK